MRTRAPGSLGTSRFEQVFTNVHSNITYADFGGRVYGSLPADVVLTGIWRKIRLASLSFARGESYNTRARDRDLISAEFG